MGVWRRLKPTEPTEVLMLRWRKDANPGLHRQPYSQHKLFIKQEQTKGAAHRETPGELNKANSKRNWKPMQK